MERCRSLRLAWRIALISLAMPVTAFAALPLPLVGTDPFGGLVDASPVILVGRCTDLQAEWDPTERVIHTTATYEVDRWVKGFAPLEQVRVRFIGGTVNHITQTAVGAPAARIGERAVLFLAPESGDRFEIVGWSRGKLPVERGAAGGDVILARWLEAASVPARPGALEAARQAPALDFPVAALEKLVRQRAEEAGR